MLKKKEQYVSYRPLHYRARFWLHSETCYTEEELNQRAWILKTRSNSGIHSDYLINPSSWFAEDSQALINVYEHSWFYSNAFKTRHVLTKDDFHVQPVDSQRLQWPALYDLMQKTGDYLLLRNQELSPEHLNQPINFFLLDLNNILKGISQNPNIRQTQEQLEHLTRYVRTVEKTLSPFVGSDRLFLANFRSMIDDEVQPQLTHKIESQLLRDRLFDLLKIIKQLSMERNRILHFALNINPVNPHSYTFAITKPDDLKAYPTQAVKDCGSSSTTTMDNPIAALKLTIDQLKNCPNFQLINMEEEILEHYALAISDLNELDQFHKVITQTIDLLGQAGEVFTIYQFKEQLSLLLKQIDYFIDESSSHIEEIIHANTQAYHKTIQEEQNLSYLQRLLSYEREKIKIFLQNQDTLAQFPSTTADLARTSKTLKEYLGTVFIHLNRPKVKKIDFEAIAGQAQELNALIHSMHQWVRIQYENKGIEPPKTPKKINFLSQPKFHSRAKPKPSRIDGTISFIDNSPKFNFSSEAFLGSRYSISPSIPLLDKCPSGRCPRNQIIPPSTTNYGLYLGLLSSFSIGLLMLYLLYKAYKAHQKTEEKIKPLGTKEEYDEIKYKIDDLFVAMQKVPFNKNRGIENRYDDFIETYNELNKKVLKGSYLIEELKDFYEDMEYFYNEYYQNSNNFSIIKINSESNLANDEWNKKS